MIVKSNKVPVAEFDAMRWREDILASPLTPRVVAHMQESRIRLGTDMRDANLQEVPELATQLAAATDEDRQRLAAHIQDHADAFVSVVERDFDVGRGRYDYIVEQAALRARQRYPLATQLHSYRIGQKVCWQTLCRVLTPTGAAMPKPAWRLMMALSVFTFEYVNYISGILANAYAEESKHLERIATAARSEFVNKLIVDSSAQSLLSEAPRFGFNRDANFVVLVCQRVEMERESTDFAQSAASDARRRLEKLLSPRRSSSRN